MSDSSSWILAAVFATVLAIAIPDEGLARQAAAATASLPPYERPADVVNRCAGLVTNRAAQRFLADSEDSGRDQNDRAYHYLGGGALGRGPTGPDERQVFVYLPSREVRVDAETGACTEAANGTTLEGAIKRSLDQLLDTYQSRVSSVLEGESSADERVRAEATARRARLREFRTYLDRTLRTCIGDSIARVVPQSIQEIVRPARVRLINEDRRLGAAPPTRN